MTEATETARKVKPIWKCQVQDCDYATPPTYEGYSRIAGHQLHHSKQGLSKEKRVFLLIDETTGEELAKTPKEAREKGFLELEPPPSAGTKPHPPAVPVPKVEMPKELKKVEPPISETQPGEVPKAPVEAERPKVELETEERGKVEITTVKTAGVFTYEITLPADAFTLFNLAKACGLEPNGEMLFDEWIWDCVRARFAKDYKKQLILAPLEV